MKILLNVELLSLKRQKKEMNKLLKTKNVLKGLGSANKSNEQKYRTYRIAISVNGEYTQLAGSVPAAAARINATMNRVNGVLKKILESI